MFRYFTAKSANKVLPEVKNLYRQVITCMKEVAEAEERMSHTAHELHAYVESRQLMNRRLVAYYEAIQRLESTGVIIKDLNEGLLDFPSKRFDEEVWLCWKSGEADVKFWHEKDSGFNGRKPIPVSTESLV